MYKKTALCASDVSLPFWELIFVFFIGAFLVFVGEETVEVALRGTYAI